MTNPVPQPESPITGSSVLDALRNMDIYLIDQLLKGRLPKRISILDAGCGEGRNLDYFLNEGGYDVYGVDTDAARINYLRKRASEMSPGLPADDRFRVEAVESMSFPDASFDVVISNAVLHFARDEAHFNAMLNEMWRVLKPGGMFFCRLASSIGIEKHIKPLEGRRYLLPDGTARFLADETFILRHTHRLGAHFLEPIKTVNVQNTRCMTTWVLKK